FEIEVLAFCSLEVRFVLHQKQKLLQTRCALHRLALFAARARRCEQHHQHLTPTDPSYAFHVLPPVLYSLFLRLAIMTYGSALCKCTSVQADAKENATGRFRTVTLGRCRRPFVI